MKRLILAGAATIALMCSAAARADVDVGISIGIPGVVFGTPGVVVATPPAYYYPPVRYVRRPPVVVVPERVYSPTYVYRWNKHDKHRHWGHHGNKHHGWHGGRGHHNHHGRHHD